MVFVCCCSSKRIYAAAAANILQQLLIVFISFTKNYSLRTITHFKRGEIRNVMFRKIHSHPGTPSLSLDVYSELESVITRRRRRTTLNVKISTSSFYGASAVEVLPVLRETTEHHRKRRNVCNVYIYVVRMLSKNTIFSIKRTSENAFYHRLTSIKEHKFETTLHEVRMLHENEGFLRTSFYIDARIGVKHMKLIEE
jgi:hypothetical protein